MKFASIAPDLSVTIQDADFPSLPTPEHLIVQVVVSGSNPKDWAMAQRRTYYHLPHYVLS